MTQPRERQNLLTDIAGISVGHAGDDDTLRSGVTAVLFERPAIAAASLLGGAPATREDALLGLEMTVERIHALVFSGGSTYGLDATAGVQAALREDFARLPAVPLPRIPIVAQASLYDLVNGGDKTWGRYSPYAAFGYEAARNARSSGFSLGTAGAGIGATTSAFKGGVGSASVLTPQGHLVAALVVVNAVGTVNVGDGPHFWAAPFERDAEFGGRGFPAHFAGDDVRLRVKPQLYWGTTIGVVATDVTLSPALVKRLAILAQDGIARAVLPAHLPRDGDAIFGISTEARPLTGAADEIAELCLAATQVTARAVARGVYAARSRGRAGEAPSWKSRFDDDR